MTTRALPFILVASLALFFSTPQARASEERLKAAFVLNFLKFITLPAPSHDTGQPTAITVCVINSSPLKDFQELETRTVGASPLKVLFYSDLPDASPCQVVFVSESYQGSLGRLLSKTEKLHALTIGESTNFLDEGGMIALVEDGDLLRFDVNLAKAQYEGITMNSQLLKIARNVRTEVS